jgi:hypothetical protein
MTPSTSIIPPVVSTPGARPPEGGLSFFSTALPLKTHLYVDGFNLYYGCLKGSQYKWLNPAEMAKLLLPGHVITAVHYFSANVTARPEDKDQPIRQQTYFRALRTVPGLTIQLGYFNTNAVRMALVDPPREGPAIVRVWRTDEKGSDVNLATQLLIDGFTGACDCAVLVTNDSDLLGPIRALRRRFGKVVGILNPQKRPARALHGEVDFYKRIRAGVLGASQFPAVLTDAKGSFSKPGAW